MDTAITLNVGGETFMTTKQTLMKLSFFRDMPNFENDDFVMPFIDRDPKTFKHILRFVRNPSYEIPEKYLYDLPYYGITFKDYTEHIALELDKIYKMKQKMLSDTRNIINSFRMPFDFNKKSEFTEDELNNL